MKKLLSIGLLCCLVAGPAFGGRTEDIAAAQAPALAWLQIWDSGDYARGREAASAYFQNDVSVELAKQVYEDFRRPYGKSISRKVSATDFAKLADGDYVHLVFETIFENNVTNHENVDLVREQDGSWKVAVWSTPGEHMPH